MFTQKKLEASTRPPSCLVVGFALRKRDYDAANYAIGHIKERLMRAKAMLELGNELSRWEEMNREQAIAIITNALDLLEMSDPDLDSICTIGNARSVLAGGGQGQMIPQVFTARVVTMINRIPTPGADAKAGTPERSEFVSKTLARALLCVGFIFRPVFQIVPNPDLAHEIKVKEWRLAAKIEAEKSRKYNLPTP